MSGSQYFIRVRGKIMGPFGYDQLRSMRDRGQFRAFHEVSEDRRSWFPASSLGELFPAGPASEGRTDPYGISATPTAPAPYPATEAGAGMVEIVPLSNPPSPRGGGSLRWILAGVVGLSVLVALAGGGMFFYRAYLSREQVSRNQGSREVAEKPASSEKSVGGEKPAADTIITDTTHEKQIAEAVGMVVAGGTVTLPDGSQGDFYYGTGTGFCITADGYILTNRHVIEEVWKLKNAELMRKKLREEKLLDVQPMVWIFFGRDKHTAEMVHVSDDYDLCILKTDRRCPSHFRLAARDDWPRSKKLVACGYPGAAQQPLSEDEIYKQLGREKEKIKRVDAYFKPRDFDFVLTEGSVSRIITEDGATRRWIQHTAVINKGNSGGPLLAEDGTVVGINTRKAIGEGVQGIFYSLSTPQLKQAIHKHVPNAAWE